MKPSSMAEKVREIWTAPIRAEKLQEQVEKLTALVHHFQDVDIKRNAGDNSSYNSYQSKVLELSKMYEGCAEFGNELTCALVSTRSMFQVGGGIKIVEKKKNQRTKDWIKKWMSYNMLDSSLPLQVACEAELEGKALFRLSHDAKSKTINVRFVSWKTNSYTVTSNPLDYTVYESVNWIPKDEYGNLNGKEVTLKEPSFVYCKFGGQLNRVNEAPPKLGSIISQIKTVSQVIADLRKINHLFASPTPHMDCVDVSVADNLKAFIKEVNWVVGKVLISAGCKFNFVSPSESGLTSLEKEYTLNIKLISATSGVPVHYLGLPDLMTNRATSDNTMENVEASNGINRGVWQYKYNEMLVKAIEMWNESEGDNLDVEAYSLELPYSSRSRLADLATTWLPMRNSGQITQKTFLKNVPGVDPETEIKELQDEMSELMQAPIANAPGVDTRDLNKSPLQQAKKAGTLPQQQGK